MNDKFEEFHKGNQQVEEQLKRANEQKSRAYNFHSNQRKKAINKDNLTLLVKLENINNREVATRESIQHHKKRHRSTNRQFTDPARVKSDHQKIANNRRQSRQRTLDVSNIKLALQI